MTNEEVENKFRSAFGGHRIVRYNQAESNDKKALGKGLCTGLCLNWARLTIVTERSRWWMVFDGTDVVRAQAEFGQENLNATAQPKLDAINKMRSKASDDFFAVKNKVNNKLRKNGTGSPWDDNMDPRIRKLVAEEEAKRAKVDALCDRMTEKVKDRALHVQWHWKAFCAAMVDTMQTEGPHYKGMVLEHLAAQAEYIGPAKQGGLKSLFTAVVSEESLEEGRAACVGLWEMSGKKEEGHMVGIFHRSAGIYELFDPNIGVWEFKKDRLVEAAAWLFFEAYPQLGDCSDAGTYERNNKAKAEYLIFSRHTTATVDI